jgi:secreted trypsin-like serine protease
VPGRELVIGSSEIDACRGDSGGPIFDLVEDRWRLIGLTSRKLPTARAACGGGGICTHVGALAPWLDQQLELP